MRETSIVRNYYLQKQVEQNEPIKPVSRSVKQDRLSAIRRRPQSVLPETLYTLLK